MAITLVDAQSLANERVSALAASASDEFIVLSDRTEEVEQGWIFFYNSKEYVETRDPMAALAGNGPILVTRTGEVCELSSSTSWEAALKEAR